MKVLVTGAAGLYGVHLVDELVKNEKISKVTGVDDFSRNFLTKDPFDLINSPKLNEKFVFIKKKFQTLNTKFLDKLDVDVIIHLAAYVSIPESMITSVKYFKNNEIGTFHFLQNVCKTKNKPHFVYASSPEVYGNPTYTPIDVDHPLYPRSIYAATKLAAEKHCYAIHQWHNYPITIIRNFNTFGENQNIWGYTAVIPQFILQALKDEDITIHNKGEQTRDFLYVKDAVKAYVQVIENKEKCSGEIFNIGTGKQTSIIELANKIKTLTNSKSKIIFKEGRSTDLLKLCADISAIKNKINWEPKYTLDQGLKNTIEWYTKFLKEGMNKTI